MIPRTKIRSSKKTKPIRAQEGSTGSKRGRFKRRGNKGRSSASFKPALNKGRQIQLQGRRPWAGLLLNCTNFLLLRFILFVFCPFRVSNRLYICSLVLVELVLMLFWKNTFECETFYGCWLIENCSSLLSVKFLSNLELYRFVASFVIWILWFI